MINGLKGREDELSKNFNKETKHKSGYIKHLKNQSEMNTIK